MGALAMVGDGTIFGANRPQLVSIEIPLSRLAQSWDGFRIAQLSDFHYDDYFSVEPLRKAIDIVNRLQPDLAVLTGDFVTSPVRKPSRLLQPRQRRRLNRALSCWSRFMPGQGFWRFLGTTMQPRTRHTLLLSSSRTRFQFCETVPFPLSARGTGFGSLGWMTFWKENPTSSWH